MQTTMSDANAEYVTVQGEVEPVQKPNWAVYNFVVGSGSGELGEKNTQSCKYDRSCDCEGGCPPDHLAPFPSPYQMRHFCALLSHIFTTYGTLQLTIRVFNTCLKTWGCAVLFGAPLN